MGQLVDEGDGRVAPDHGVEVHLLDDDVTVGCALAGHHLQPVEEPGGVGAAVGFHEPDHDVGAAVLPAVALLQHAVRLADARSHAQVDPQPAATRPLRPPDPGEHLLRRGAEVEGVPLAHGRRPRQAVAALTGGTRPGRG